MSLDFVQALDAATTTNDSKLCLLFICHINGFSFLFYYLIIVSLTMFSLTYHLSNVF